MMALVRRCAWMMAFVLAASMPAWSQATGLTGKVTDPSGAVVTGAEVTLVHEGTGLTRTTKTDENGAYIFPQLSPATYRLEVTMQGFKKAVREHLSVPIGLTTTMNVSLEVGALTEEVVVEATGSTLNTTDASLGIPFSGNQVRNLPSLNLDPSGLLSLQPGVTYVPGASETPGGYAVGNVEDGRGGSVNGARSDQTNITLDGVDVNDSQFGYAFTSALRATQASLQEFRVTTSNYNADAGRSSAAQVQLETKSGSNDLHGQVYWGHRNAAANANDFFLNRDSVEKGKFQRHIFGAALGGPIVKDRLFLFGNWEDLRHKEDVPTLRSVPSLSFRDGVLIYRCEDLPPNPPCPTMPTTVAGLSGTVYDVPEGFFGMSPAQLMQLDPLGVGANPAALMYFQGYPIPNAPGTFDRVNIVGFNFAAPIDNTFHTYILRADANIDRAAKHSVYWRGTLQDDAIVAEPPQFPGDDPNQTRLGASKGFALGYKAVLGASAINTFRWGYTRIKESTAGRRSQEFIDFRFIDNLEEEVGDLNADSDGRTIPQQHFRDDISWTRGAHTMSAGFDIRFTRNSRFTNSNSFPGFFMNPSWLNNVGRALEPGEVECDPVLRPICAMVPSVAGTGDEFRDSVVNLFGIITQASASYNFDRTGATLPVGESVRRHFAVDEYEWYFQDQWRMTPTFTLTFGVRYFLTSPPWETNGNQVVPILRDNITGEVVPGGLGDWFEIRRQLMLAGQPSNLAPQISFDLGGPANGRAGYYHWDTNNWSPRIAAAWAPQFKDGWLHTVFGDGKTVLRGGYSLVYDRIGNGLTTSFNDFGSFGMSTAIDSTFGGCDEGEDAGTPDCPRFTGVFNVGPASGLLPPSPGGGFPSTPPGENPFGSGILDGGAFAITQALDNSIRTPKAHVINFAVARRFGRDFTVEASYVGRKGRNLLTIRDLAMPADVCDSIGGDCYFTSAQQLITLFEQGVDITDAQFANDTFSNGYWSNLFPSWGPGGVNGGFLPCDLFGADPGGAGGFSATQVAYDWINCVHPDTTVAPFVWDSFGFPGYMTCTSGSDLNYDFDGDGVVGPGEGQDGIPDCPFGFFDDQYSSLNAWSSIGKSEYHAFQLTVRKAFSHGFSFDFNYTLAKSLDYTSVPERADVLSGYETLGGGYTGSAINSWQPELEYSFSDYDMRHQINANWYVELPFGRGKTYGSDVSGWVDQIIGGWSTSGIFRWNSRLPANVINDRVWPTNWDLQGNATCGPVVPDPSHTAIGGPCPPTQNSHGANNDRGPNLWQDPDGAFPFFHFTLPGLRGQRNVVRGDSYYSMDFALAKAFPMPWEGHRLQFRWEVFNITNTPYFDTLYLSASIGIQGTFGDYSRVLGGPRQMQFSLRYEF